MDSLNKLIDLLAPNCASDENAFITADTLIKRINAFSAHYKKLDMSTAVVLYHSDSVEFFIRLMALAQTPIDIILPPNAQPQTLAKMRELSAFFCGEHSAASEGGFSYIDEALDDTSSSSLAEQRNDDIYWPNDKISGRLIFFTSGSSGPAKAIYKTWTAINRELNTLEQTFMARFTTDSPRFVAMVSHQHIYGLLFKVLWPARFGHCWHGPMFHYPEHLAQYIDSQAPNNWVLIASPAQYSRLVQDNVLGGKRSNLTLLFSSGGPLEDSDATHLYQQFERAIIQVYGSTETGGIAYRQVSTSGAVPWQPFPGVALQRHNGQLTLKSPLLDEPMRLDDKVQLLSNGEFMLLGRADRTVKVAEKRVNLVGMEARLIAHPWVKHAAIMQLSTGRLGALVVLTREGLPQFEQCPRKHISQTLKVHLGQEFEAVCLPRKWRYLQSLPYNSQGKLVPSELESYFD